MKSETKTHDTAPRLDSGERDRLLMEHLPQVRYIAQKIRDRLPQHIALEDLIQAGVLGLIDALHKYEPDKNVQFQSYARFRIRGAILDSLRALDWSPRDLRKKARRLEQAHRQLEARCGRSATEAELAAEMDISLSELHSLLADLRGLDLGSLREEISPDGSVEEVCCYLPNAPEEDPFYLCLQSEMKELLACAISELPERNRQVLALYYFEELTMKEVGMALGVGESRISQIHSDSLVRLRARMREFLESAPAQLLAARKQSQWAVAAS